jgi:hypothetical protein
MKISCSYHPKVEAEWFCPSCSTIYCNECASKKTVGGYSSTQDLKFCMSCSHPLVRDFEPAEIAPLLKRLPSALAYPIKPSPFSLMLVLSILAFISFELTRYGIIIAIGLWAIWLKYSISSMLATSEGKLTPPDIQSEPAAGEMPMLLKQMLILYPVGFAGYMIYKHSGQNPAMIYFMLMAFLLPAILTILVTKNSLMNALNLVWVVRIPLMIGTPYIMMCLFVVGIVGSISMLTMHIFQYVPEDRFVFLSVMLTNYFTLLVYHLIGYMIYRHHEKLEFETVYSRKFGLKIKTPQVSPSVRGLYNMVNQLLRQGQIEGAAAIIRDNTRAIHDSIDVAERYYNLLKMLGLKDQMLMNAPVYLNHLCINDRTDKLVDVYIECININGEFTPERDAAIKIANTLNSRDRYSDAVKLLERFASMNPNDAATPRVYYQAAEIVISGSQDREKAKDLLNVIVSTFPLHEITPYAKKKLKDLGVKEALHVAF